MPQQPQLKQDRSASPSELVQEVRLLSSQVQHPLSNCCFRQGKRVQGTHLPFKVQSWKCPHPIVQNLVIWLYQLLGRLENVVFTLRTIASYSTGGWNITKVRRSEWIGMVDSLPGKCYPYLPDAKAEPQRAVTSLSCLVLG